MLRPPHVWLLLCLIPLLLSCGSDAPTPEERIRLLLTDAETAVESRSVSTVEAFLSARYRDDHGQDRRAVLRLLAGYFLGHQSIHLLTQVTELSLVDAQEAKVTLYVAVAGQPIDSSSQLVSLRADLIRLDLQMVFENSEWRVISAAWRRAAPSDFLN